MAVELFTRGLRGFQSLRAYSGQVTRDVLQEVILHKTPAKIKSEKVPWPVYGGRHLVTMLPGSGIGPEMTTCVKEIFQTAQVPVDFEIIEGSGEQLVQDAITSIRRNRVAIKGNLVNVLAEDDGFIAPNVLLRAKLDLFVYLIHYKTYPSVQAKFPGIDVLLIRQNTEGEYAMLEHESVKGVVESMKIITRSNTERLAKFAFEETKRRGRKKITVVHKSRQLELSDGLFLEIIQKEARNHPQVQVEDIFIDRCCQKLVKSPVQFDVLLLPNLYGTIVSNIVCGLAGGAGLFSGVNYGEDFAVFEPSTRHTAEILAGKNVANPVAMLNASVNMLRYLGKNEHANLIDDAIYKTLCYDHFYTSDIGGDNSTTAVVDRIKQFIVKNLSKYKTKF